MGDIFDYIKEFFLLLVKFLTNLKTGGLIDILGSFGIDVTGLIDGLINKE